MTTPTTTRRRTPAAPIPTYRRVPRILVIGFSVLFLLMILVGSLS